MVSACALALETEFGLNAGVHEDALAACVAAIQDAEAQSMTEIKTDTDLLTSIETHRERLAQMVARAPVQIVPSHTVAEAAMTLAEEIVQARKRIPRVDYHVRDTAVRHAVACELAECGYDVDEFLDSIS